MAASKTQADELYQPWKVEAVFLEEVTVGDDTLLRNVLWLQRGAAIVCSPYNMEDGVRQRNTLSERIANTGNLTDVGMEREDLGPMMSTFLEV